MGDSEKIAKLKKVIDCNVDDPYLDIDEERSIFDRGASLGISKDAVEEVLNHFCQVRQWTRQSCLTEELTALLEEATRDDGIIDKLDFEYIVNFAVKRHMPRRDAIGHCITVILNSGWRVWEGFFDKWFSRLQREYEVGPSPAPSRHVKKSTGMNNGAKLTKLRCVIANAGVVDGYVDESEEQHVFGIAESFEISRDLAERMLQEHCEAKGWTREAALASTLEDMLGIIVDKSSMIGKDDYELVLQYGVSNLMPRKDTERLCLRLILKHSWPVNEGPIGKWFATKRKTYGL